MYTAEQYSRAKDQVDGAPPEAQAILRQRMSEFEHSNPQHGRGQRFSAEPAPGVGQVPKDVPAEEPVDTSTDDSLPTASKLKTIAAPPEYVSKNPTAAIRQVYESSLDPLPANPAGKFYEPSEQQFETDMGPVLKARGIAPGSDEYKAAHAEYSDRKWQQAYQQAQANDAPLTRVAYAHKSEAWPKLSEFLDNFPDMASAFAKGYANGAVPGVVEGLDAVSDKISGNHTGDEDREQANRNPVATGAGEIAGALNPRGALAKVASAPGKIEAIAGSAPRLLRRLGTSMLGGALASEGALAGNTLGQSANDEVQGRGTDSAKDTFTSRLLGTGLVGGLFGAGGHLIGEGADAVRRALRGGPLGGELGSLEAGGGATDIVRGVKPPEEVKANLEAARPPVPGEAKPEPEGTALELQAKKVQGPIAAQNVSDQAEFKQRAAAENQAEVDRDPNLQKPKPATATANAVVDLVKARTQPEGRDVEFLPGAGQALPGRNNGPFIDLAKKFWKPRIVLGIDAAKQARAGGGRVVSLVDAEALGYDTKALRQGLTLDTETGVPKGAPTIPDEPSSGTNFDSAAQAANDVAKETGTHPELNRFLNENRKAENAAERDGVERVTSKGVTDFIAAAKERGAVYDGPTYRGTSPEELDNLLQDGETRNTWSVSKDREGAAHFAKNGGVLLEIEPGAGAVPVDGIEGSNTFGEALLPKGQRFEVVSERTEGGVRVVKLRQAGPDTGAGSTTEEVFGRPSDKLPGGPSRILTPRLGRAKPPPAPTPGSEWDVPGESEARFDYMYGNAPSRAESPPPVGDDITPTRVSENVPRPPRERWATPSSPAGPPPELAAANSPPVPTGLKAQTGVPDSEYRVVLEPRSYNAQDFEKLVEALDDAAKADRKGAHVDPAWKDFQRSIRQDREQFGQRWTDLKAAHHAEKTDLEQRAGHANLGETPQEYEEMPANAQKSYNAGLVNFGSRGSAAESNAALRSLAERAGVKSELETLRSQRAYDALKEKATPAVRESMGVGGAFARLGGLGPAMKLRSDAAARALARGPEGTGSFDPSKLSPELLALVRKGAPIGADVNPSGLPREKGLLNVFGMGRGALGLKAGSAYNATRERGASRKTLSPEETQFLEKLLAATQEAP